IAGLLFPLHLSAMPSLAFVGEWQKTDLSRLQPFEVGLAIALYAGATRHVRPGLVRTGAIVGLACLAILHARHQMLLAIVTPLLLAEPFGARLEGAEGRAGSAPKLSRLTAAACAVCVLTIAAARLALPFARTNGNAAPVTALANVPSTISRERVL